MLAMASPCARCNDIGVDGFGVFAYFQHGSPLTNRSYDAGVPVLVGVTCGASCGPTVTASLCRPVLLGAVTDGSDRLPTLFVERGRDVGTKPLGKCVYLAAIDDVEGVDTRLEPVGHVQGRLDRTADTGRPVGRNDHRFYHGLNYPRPPDKPPRLGDNPVAWGMKGLPGVHVDYEQLRTVPHHRWLLGRLGRVDRVGHPIEWTTATGLMLRAGKRAASPRPGEWVCFWSSRV